MSEMGDPLSFAGVKLVHLIAGTAGGIVRAITRPDLSWGRRISTGIAGALVAAYGTPVASPLLWHHLPEQVLSRVTYSEIDGLVGFVLGMTGLAIADAIVKIVRRWIDRVSARA